MMIFVIGDRRANENPHLAMAHVVFTKFHNQVAEQLGQINPHWDNNHLFEVGALFMILCMTHVIIQRQNNLKCICVNC